MSQEEELYKIRKKYYDTTYRDAKKCSCCLLPLQKEELPLTMSLDKVNHLGISTHLYFQSIVNVFILLFIMLVLFALFAIPTNLAATSRYKQAYNGWQIENKYNTFSGVLAASIGSKYYINDLITNLHVTVQCWMGFITVLLWAFAFLWLKMRDRRK